MENIEDLYAVEVPDRCHRLNPKVQKGPCPWDTAFFADEGGTLRLRSDGSPTTLFGHGSLQEIVMEPYGWDCDWSFWRESETGRLLVVPEG